MKDEKEKITYQQNLTLFDKNLFKNIWLLSMLA